MQRTTHHVLCPVPKGLSVMKSGCPQCDRVEMILSTGYVRALNDVKALIEDNFDKPTLGIKKVVGMIDELLADVGDA